ncbi:hypothetical protein OIU76_022727 [Salix suchowensis]|nr:hypothetical protein OIU76_022727 [Salix suchowensis]
MKSIEWNWCGHGAGVGSAYCDDSSEKQREKASGRMRDRGLTIEPIPLVLVQFNEPGNDESGGKRG